MILLIIKLFYAQDYVINASQNHLADPTFLNATFCSLLCRVRVITLNFVVVQMLESERDGQIRHVPVSFG